MCVLRGAHVIACDMSAARLEAAKKLGAIDTVKVDEVEDQAQAVKDLTEDGRGVDVAIEATGVPPVWAVSYTTLRHLRRFLLADHRGRQEEDEGRWSR